MTVAISATGLWTPSDSITNAELVASFNTYVERFNAENAGAIEAGAVKALQPSSVEFIEKASGIKHRFVMDKAGRSMSAAWSRAFRSAQTNSFR